MYCVAEMKRAYQPANTCPGPKLWCKHFPGPWAPGRNLELHGYLSEQGQQQLAEVSGYSVDMLTSVFIEYDLTGGQFTFKYYRQ